MRPPTAIRTTSKVKLLCFYVTVSFVCRIIVNYIRLFFDMVGTKHCSWGRCNMDSRYPDRMPQSLKELQESDQKVFIPFVKPWHDLERCKKWVNACSRKNFTTESITKNSYICALHWPKQKGTTSSLSSEDFQDHQEHSMLCWLHWISHWNISQLCITRKYQQLLQAY